MGITENGWNLDHLLGPPWARLVGIETGGASSGGGDGSGDGDPDGDEDKDDEPKPKMFTEAEVAKLIRDERRKRRTIKPKAKADPDDEDDSDDGKDDEVKTLRREVREMRAEREHERLMTSAREAAIDAGTDPARVRRLLKVADLDGIKSSDSEAIADAIAEALEDFPEFVKAPDDDSTNGDGKRRPASSTRDDTNDQKPRRKRASDDADPGPSRLRAAYAEQD